jgi:hypothetical protein
MRTDCCYCRGTMRRGDESEGTSHGICRGCIPRVARDYGLTKEEEDEMLRNALPVIDGVVLSVEPRSEADLLERLAVREELVLEGELLPEPHDGDESTDLGMDDLYEDYPGQYVDCPDDAELPQAARKMWS